MQYTEEEIREEEEQDRAEEIRQTNLQIIEMAQVYTGEINPNDVYPQAVIINMNESKALCNDDGKGIAFCLIFVISVAFICFMFYISIPQPS